MTTWQDVPVGWSFLLSLVWDEYSANVQFVERLLLCSGKEMVSFPCNNQILLFMSKTANIDYLCVIRENGERTTFETIDIPASTDLVSTLEGMVDNDSASVLDMQSHLNYAFPEEERKPMNYVSPFSYGSAFIEGTIYPASISYQEYKDILAEKAESLAETFEERNKYILAKNPSAYSRLLSEFVEKGIADYKVSLKKDYLSKARRFIMAKNYTKTLNSIKGNPDIRMYSTDTLGWSDFKYRVTDDITINLGTNFGYGSASYFRLCLKYKGIDILPYSFVVKYFFANRRDILRYTRMYDVAHDSWNIAFDFVEKTANLAAEDAEQFVKEYILGEIQQMMHGLEKILKDPNAYASSLAKMAGKRAECHFLTVRNMNIYEQKCYGAYPGEMSMVIKAEKITGALDFLDNMMKLSESIPEIQGSIDEIKAMSQEVLPEIISQISVLVNEIAALQEKKASAERKLEGLKEKAAPHVKRIDLLYEDRVKKDKYLSRSTVEEEYIKKHSDYAELKAQIETAQEELDSICGELRMREGFRSSLSDCVRRVQDAGLASNDNVAA